MPPPTRFEMGSDHRPDPVDARVVTSGERVVCGFKGCEEPLLYIRYPSPDRLRGGDPFIDFTVGFWDLAGVEWAPDPESDDKLDGYFRFVQHARAKLRRDELIAPGHRWDDRKVIQSARDRLSTGNSRVAARPATDDYGHQQHTAYSIGNGSRIECPKCRRINTVPGDASSVAEMRLRKLGPTSEQRLRNWALVQERLRTDPGRVLAELQEAGRLPRLAALPILGKPEHSKPASGLTSEPVSSVWPLSSSPRP